MTLAFPDSKKIYQIDDAALRVQFVLETTDSGLSAKQTIKFAEKHDDGTEDTPDVPQNVKDALTVVKDYMDAQAKADCESKGLSFDV